MPPAWSIVLLYYFIMYLLLFLDRNDRPGELVGQ